MNLTAPEITLLVLAAIMAVAIVYAFSRRPKDEHRTLNERERCLHQEVFNELTADQFVTLMAFACWRRIGAGETLIRHGEPVNFLSLVASGELTADIDNRRSVTLTQGQFIGEMNFLSESPGAITVVANKDSVLVEWPKSVLKRRLAGHTSLSNCLQAKFQRDLIKKLEQ